MVRYCSCAAVPYCVFSVVDRPRDSMLESLLLAKRDEVLLRHCYTTDKRHCTRTLTVNVRLRKLILIY